MTPRPVTDDLVSLQQAVDLLKVAEDLAQPDNIERYPGAIASVIRSARTLVEEVIEALTRTSLRKEVATDRTN